MIMVYDNDNDPKAIKVRVDYNPNFYCFIPALEYEWQGQKDLNPQPMVLETTTLPIELYPYVRQKILYSIFMYSSSLIIKDF